MKIVIEIDNEHYERIMRLEEGVIVYPTTLALYEAVKNGTPLPKGHGDLIDRSTLEPDTEWSDWDDGWISYSYGQIVDADVVIKADGGEEDEVSN